MPPTGETDKDGAIAIPVPTAKKEANDKKKAAANKKGASGKGHEHELSEEDKALKEGLELAVTRLAESDVSLHRQALEHLRNEIKSATSSMTSVPKPLKFLRPHYDTLKKVYQGWHAAHDLKQELADVLSVLAMTMAPEGTRECLGFKLQGTSVDISSWGHEYVRTLSGQISEEYNQRVVEQPSGDDTIVEDDLMTLVDDIIPFQMQHNAEAEAVDLLLEVQQLKRLREPGIVDDKNFERVCLYLLRCADFISEPEDLQELHSTAFFLYKAFGRYTDALRVAIKTNELELVRELFSEESGASDLMRKQMALILGRSRSNFETGDEDLDAIIGNARLSEYFLDVAKRLDVVEPKSPENIFKTHLVEGGLARSRNQASNNNFDSARANLASSFVNGFVNAGFCADTLMCSEGNRWIFRNKDLGVMSATASLGLVLLWNVEEGLSQIDRYYHNNDEFVRAGACLAIGIVSSGVRNEADPALALLSDYLSSPSLTVRRAAISGLGIAYAGSQRQEIVDLLTPVVANTEGIVDMTEVSLAALSIGMIFVGSCDDEICSIFLQRLMESSTDELDHTSARFLCLGLGLLFLAREEKCEAALEALLIVEHPLGKYASVTLETCAYAGTGNVLKVQQMLHLCAEHHETPGAAAANSGVSTADATPAAPTPAPKTSTIDAQLVATLGIALITVGEDIGTEMSLRMFDHLLQYGGLPVRRVVPLAYSLLYVSHPDYSVMDQLSRLSHDADPEVAMNAIFGLGLISAGTNNSRIAGLLRQLSEFYSRETETHLFVVRIAQGLNAMGKGLLHLNPFHSDRFVRGERFLRFFLL
jgi:26S proteasome regulatory subunit N1